MSEYNYIPKLETGELIATGANTKISNIRSPLNVNETEAGNVCTIAMKNIGGSGSTCAILMSPWSQRNGGSSCNIVSTDRAFSSDLKVQMAPFNNQTAPAVTKLTINHTGMRVGDDQLPTKALQVTGDAEVSRDIKVGSLTFAKDGVRMIPMSFKIPVTSNEENIIPIDTIMTNYGVTSLAQFRGLTYWLAKDPLTFEVNKDEYDNNTTMKWKIQIDSGVPTLYIRHRQPFVDAFVNVFMWWALPSLDPLP